MKEDQSSEKFFHYPTISLAIMCVSWILLEWRVEVIDGPDMKLHGFPIPWYHDSISLSLVHHVFWPALLLDFLFFLLIFFLLFKVSIIRRYCDMVHDLIWVMLGSVSWLFLTLFIRMLLSMDSNSSVVNLDDAIELFKSIESVREITVETIFLGVVKSIFKSQ